MKKAVNSFGILAAVATALFTGCASTTQLTIDPMPDSMRYTETITFGDKLNVAYVPTVQDENDAEEVVNFALSLSALGRHQHAAEFLADAAVRFRSSGKQLEVALLAGAANEYLQAGDMAKFRDTVRDLRQTASRYQYAAFDAHTAALVSLGDIASGGTKPTELTPSALKELYRVKASEESR